MACSPCCVVIVLQRVWVTVLEDLGKGNFGTVSKGIYEERGALVRTPSYLVAVKVLTSKDVNARSELLEEALVMVHQPANIID